MGRFTLSKKGWMLAMAILTGAAALITALSM